MTTNEAIAIAISDTDCMPYRYKEASRVLADEVLNLREELSETRKNEIAACEVAYEWGDSGYDDDAEQKERSNDCKRSSSTHN